ncbi:MAG: NnrU protein, partial [Acetobacteraceae bacterium]|nr:NnrU protein [Acetobacteraceae bacterium]
TSIVPFGAIHDGRNQFIAAEIGIVPVAIGALLWAVLLWAHPYIFGVSAMPAG